MKSFRLSIDDNIWVFRDLAKSKPVSIFENSYMALLKDLHDIYGVKVHMNVFFETDGFTLRDMPDCWKAEWKENSDWLKLSFHSRAEFPDFPYANSGYDEVYNDCVAVQNEILRFAGKEALSFYTTLHYTAATKEGVRALKDAGIKGLVGLFGTVEKPMVAYSLPDSVCDEVRKKGKAYCDQSALWYVKNDLVINNFKNEQLEGFLNEIKDKPFLEVMIHEQYFYNDYAGYQPDFCKKLKTVLDWMKNNDFKSVFLEDIFDK